MSDYEWATRPPNIIERIIAGMFVAVLLVSSASSYAVWGIFGAYDGEVAAGCVILGLILIRFLPTVGQKQSSYTAVESGKAYMTLKQDLTVFAVMAFLFTACSIGMVTAHVALSRYPIVTYGFLSVYGISALASPIFLIRAIRKAIGSALRKHRT